MPYVGIDALTIGKQVGAEIARQVKAAGWDKDWSTVRVGSVEDQKADTCMRRNRGAEEAFLAAVPGLPARRTSSASPTTTRWSTRSTWSAPR